MSKTTGCDLATCFLCNHSDTIWRELIALKKTTHFFKKGKRVFSEGEKVNGFYFIYEGAVKVHKEWLGKKELIIRFAKGGGVLGHRGLGISKVYPVSATTLEDSKVCFIENDFFEALLRSNPSLSYQFMHFYADELQRAELRMRDLALMEVKGRIAGTLLDLADTFGTGRNKYIAVPINRQDIAAYSGTTYETVFKFLRTLIANKTITVSGKNIRINDMARLKSLVKTAK